jgi:AraC-like DNA-binding protein
MSPENRAEMRDALDRALALADRGRLRLRVPESATPARRLPSMHYHYRPEIFFQLSGRTHFRFPRETFELAADELCVIPAGVPHGETVYAEGDRPFRNLVAGFYNNTLSLHFAYEASPRKPDIEVIEFFDAPNLDVFLTLANSLPHTFASRAPARDATLKGLLLALLGLFRSTVEIGTGTLNSDMGKVFQAKCVVREQFANPELTVQHVADVLGCSADYLSHRFHTETKERLTHYIQRIRVSGAMLALSDTALTVSEIAYSSGFSDPAYFARVFRQHKGVTPHEYRAQLDASRTRQETDPKTVYFKKLDYSPGTARRSLGTNASAPAAISRKTPPAMTA